MRRMQLERIYMKPLAEAGPRRVNRRDFAVPRHPKLVGQWQLGMEMISGHAQWKLHLTLAQSPSPLLQH